MLAKEKEKSEDISTDLEIANTELLVRNWWLNFVEKESNVDIERQRDIRLEKGDPETEVD
jgi:hypothetical protein